MNQVVGFSQIPTTESNEMNLFSDSTFINVMDEKTNRKNNLIE
jgi:hypothetical protein